MPPLLLDDEEVVAVAVGLRTSTGSGVTGIEEASLRALVKLEQLMPSRLRHRIDALRAATVSVPGAGPTVDSEVLGAIAGAIRASERLRFAYVDHDGNQTVRTVEPERLVVWGSRWYLLAWDVDRGDWRIFRVDRITPKTPTGPRFKPRTLTDEEAARHVQRSVGTATWRYRARIRIHAPGDQTRALLPLAVEVLEDGPDHCIIEVGSDTPHQLALYIGLLDTDFEILGATRTRRGIRSPCRALPTSGQGVSARSTCPGFASPVKSQRPRWAHFDSVVMQIQGPTSYRTVMLGIRSAASAGNPSAAATSPRPGQLSTNPGPRILTVLRPTEPGQRRDADSTQHRCIFWKLRAFPGNANRVTKATQLINQTSLERISASPDATSGDSFNLGHRALPPCGDLGHEIVVDGVDGHRESCPLVLAEPLPELSTSRPARPAARCLC